MIDPLRLRRLRAQAKLLAKRLRLSVWFPHVPLALLLSGGGFMLLNSSFSGHWAEYFQMLVTAPKSLNPALLPPLLVGGGMLVMGIGLFFRSRLAWVIALLLVAGGIVSVALGPGSEKLIVYFALILVALFVFWRSFDRSSIAASTLFALTSLIMLIGYSTFGAYYLGDQFDSEIPDLATAFYWSMVTMSTVGYGDISPVSTDARMFSGSVIVLGITVFATSLPAIIMPLITRSLSRIVQNPGSKMKRENHFIVIGNTFLAANTARALRTRGQAVTRVFVDEPNDGDDKNFDYVVGKPSSGDVLREAGVENAEAVLAMTHDDSENAFVVLAVKQLASDVETIVAVNDANNLDRIKLAHPDTVLTPQLLGGELAAMLLSGEEVTTELIMSKAFERLKQD